MVSGMRVLVACEYSGRVRDAFIANGHDAVSCDILPSDRPDSGPHIQGNVLDVIEGRGARFYGPFDLMVAHPPCTYLANSGARHLYNPDGTRYEPRWEAMRAGAEFFRALLEADIPRIAVENPIMVGHARELVGARQSQIIQPWQFGHGETKATALWLRGLPLLQPTDIVDGREARVHRLPPTADRWKLRSTTYQGIADAMGAQWGAPP